MAFVPSTRKPTGIPSSPLIAVSGLAKSGKSLTSYKLGLSDRIHNCWVADLGEGSADEYGALGCFEVLEWGRSWVDLQETVKWCIDQPCPEGTMNALIIDSGTEVWDGLKARADKRARNSQKNRKALEADPDYEVDVSMPFWNDAKETWARIVSPMKLARDLVGVIIVRSEIVAEVVNGAPTNRKITSYQCEKTLMGMVTAHVDVRPDHSAVLVDVRSMAVSVTRQGLPLNPENPLGDLLEKLSPTNVFQAPVVVAPIDDQRDDPDRVAAEVAQDLIAAMNTVADEAVRTGLKKAFAAKFGRPDQLNKGIVDEAFAWIGDRLLQLAGALPAPHAEPEPPAAEPPADTEPPAPSAEDDAGPWDDAPGSVGDAPDPVDEPVLQEAML